MKIRKVLVLVAAALLGTTANAQIDNTLQFVDADGNVIPDGSTITVTDVEMDEFTGLPYQINSGLYVKKNSSEEVGAMVEVNVSRMDNGSLACCFPGSCAAITATGTYETPPGTMSESSKDFQTEWVFDSYGTCTATFSLKLMDFERNSWGMPENFTFKADGPSVTVNFVYSDPTGIDGITGDGKKTVTGYYSVDGRRLSAPQKGINIVEYSDGKRAKILSN